MTAKASFLRSHDMTKAWIKHARAGLWDQINVRGEVWELTGGGWALMRAAVHSLEEPKMDAFLWKKAHHSRFQMRPKNSNRLALEVNQRCLFHRAPDKESLCCTYIMNAKMRLQMHNEDDFMYPIPLRLTNICRNNPTQAKSFEKIDSWACKLAIWHRLIPLFTFHMDTHTHTCTRKHPNSPQKSRAHTQATENRRLLLTGLVCLVFEDRRTPKEEDEERWLHIKRNGLETS